MFLLLQMAPRRLSLHGNGREAERQEEGERTFSCLFAGCLASSDLSSIGSSPLKQEGVPVSSFCPPSQDASYCPSEGPAAARGRPSPGADSGVLGSPPSSCPPTGTGQQLPLRGLVPALWDPLPSSRSHHPHVSFSQPGGGRGNPSLSLPSQFQSCVSWLPVFSPACHNS